MKLHTVFSLTLVITFGYLNSVDGQKVQCPAVRTTSGWLDLFPLPCRKNSECRVMSKQHLCCKGFCTKGVKVNAALQRQRTNNQQNNSKVVEPSSISISTSTQPSTSTAPSTSTTTTTSTTTSTTTTSTTTTTTPPPTTTTPPPTTTTQPTTTTTSTTSSTTTTTTTPPPPTTTTTTTTTPAPQPFLQLLPIQISPATTPKSSAPKSGNSITSADVTYSRKSNFGTVYEYNVGYSSTGKTQKLVCPTSSNAPVLLFPIPCQNNAQCRVTSGPNHVCCEGRCIKGIPAPRPISPPKPHQPLLGVIPRECPAEPLGELLFEVQTCKSDGDCWPRVCCPDGTRSYCRTARARLDLVPIANQIDGPVRMLEQYLQCTPPPQFDVFPQKCTSTVDCLPNLCCAEGGKKHCRPPKRSLLSLLAGVTQRFGASAVNIGPAQDNNNRL